ncbi:MAG: OadG family protein [Chromatiales bacterium]|nr:OadG family protein [Chromatiales bacterium]
MPVGELLLQGVELMLLGMGVVFLFLTLLVGMVSFMSFLVTRFAPEQAEATVGLSRPPPTIGVRNDDQQVVAVISAAVKRYRERHKTGE